MRTSVLVAGALLLVLVVAAVVFGPRSVDELRAAIDAAGPLAPLAFVGLQVACTIAPIPRTPFTLAAGVLFGALTGILVAVVATVTAAAGAFMLVRTVGQGELGQRLLGRFTDKSAVRWMDRRLDGRGTATVLSLRLLPLLPFAVLNYCCGLSSVRFWPFLLGTAVGVLPGTIAVVVLGDAVTGTVSPGLLMVSVVSALIGVTGVVLAGRAIPDRPPRQSTKDGS